MNEPKSREAMQAAFNKACAALKEQGEQSTIRGTCYYRSERFDSNKTLKCAVGHLMTDEQMTKHGIGEGYLPYQFPDGLLNEIMPGEDPKEAKDFLRDLQRAHDNYSHLYNVGGFWNSFKESANIIAIAWNLTPFE